MMFGMAAATSALDLIKTLTSSQSSSKTANKTAFSAASQTANASSSSTASSGQTNLISADTMNALFQAQSDDAIAATRTDALKSLFKTLDADGSGKVSKSEFESALGAGGTNVANADKVFGKMDADGDGNISLDEMASALKPKKAKPNKPGGNVETLMQMLDTIQANNAASLDASLTTRASASASTSATRAYNGIEQMLQRQADLVTRNMSATSSLSVSV